MHYQTNLSTYAPVTPGFSEVLEDNEAYHPKQSRQRKHPETTLLKRISLNRLMDLKIDYAFKQLFGNEKNKAITVVFLHSFLQKTNHEPITDITFDNTEKNAVYDGDKESGLDILAVKYTELEKTRIKELKSKL